jgi:hypothetical protein
MHAHRPNVRERVKNRRLLTNIEDVIRALNQRTGILRCLAYHIPQRDLIQVAESICTSKLRYGFAAYGIPRVRDDDPKRRSMQDLQVSQNEVDRVLTRCKIIERVTVHHLLEKASMTAVNRMAAETIIMEMWCTMGGNSVEKESLEVISSMSTLETRSGTEGKLQGEHPQHAWCTMV